jgi:hypothetical protein
MTTKNFGLIGVGSTLQLGKNGGVFDFNTGKLRARNAANSAFINFQAASPVANDDVATKQYVDGLVAGGVRYRGTVDASAANPAAAGVIGIPANGDQYKATTAGNTAFGFQLNVGDFVIYNGTIWDKIDATDPSITGTSNRITVTATGDTSYQVDIASTYVGQTSITTLGTITTGTWNGTVIGTTYGGTGLGSLGTANQQLRVNAGGTALEYFTPTAIDSTRITNLGGTTFVDTDEVANTVVANVNGDRVFEIKNTGGTADSIFEIEAGTAGEISINVTSGTATDSDLRLNPLGNGRVIVGGTGAAVVQANTDEDLQLFAGDGVNGGDLVLKAGNGSTTSGTIRFLDNSASENLIFEVGAGNAATNLELTSSATGVTLSAKGSATNIDLILGSKTPGNNVGLVKAVAGYDAALTTNYATDSNETFVTLGTVKAKLAEVAAGVDPEVRRGSFTTTASTNIGTVLPTVAYIGRAIVRVTSAYTSGGTFTLKAGATTIAGDSDVDLQATGTYLIDIYDGANYGATQLAVEIGGSPAAGAAIISVEYKIA